MQKLRGDSVVVQKHRSGPLVLPLVTAGISCSGKPETSAATTAPERSILDNAITGTYELKSKPDVGKNIGPLSLLIILLKVLITGASGRLGSYVVRELESDHELVLASRTEPPEAISHHPWVRCDVTSFEDCQKAVKGVEAVQHLGAQPWPVDHPGMRAKAEEDGIPFDTTFKSNMLGTYYMLMASVEAGVKTFVFCGSNCSLGHGFRISDTPFPIESLPIDETHPCLPEDSYSYTKRAGEDLLASFSRGHGIRTYATRPAGITPAERREAMKANAGPAKGWNPWLWCWVGSEDVASAHRILMEAAGELPTHDVYFLNGNDTTALESSRELVEKFKPELAEIAESMEGHQSFLSNAKLRGATGWEHKTSWRDEDE